ncbi:hypothetical protein AB0H28_23430 [Micromonospora sp. NPDC050980]|uniref:hypothetical protein n=1 Tax=Micromonospora sp. NPDC050980 TaxID=3155161 RepID=UPI0034069DD2
MDGERDGALLAAALGRRLGGLTFTDLSTDRVTALIVDAVAAWARERGWRVYRRAPSVLPLPPPMADRHSVLDVACARPDGPPVVVEVDHTDRRRTWEKLAAEVAAGRVAIWVRWGAGRFVAPPAPLHLVTCEVTRRAGPPGVGRLHSRSPSVDRPPPRHCAPGAGVAVVAPLPLPEQF